ncbi:MAG: CPBP family intramembrane glutamic endopeptidase [Dehalococcoidales bacterium]|jgi:membrane protease YdiL (CAAX protease family)
MLHFITQEFVDLGQFFKRNGRETVIVTAATLFLTLDRYRPIGSEWVSTTLYYGIFPLLVVFIILRKSPGDFGLGMGSPRLWWFPTALICLVAGGILFAASFSADLQGYYRDAGFNFITYSLTSCASLAASEFLYRGFLLFGLKDKFHEGSILLQMIPFVLMHLGKPELETVSTIVTGILFGYVCYRGKSFWPAFIIHLFINVFFVSLINFRYPV